MSIFPDVKISIAPFIAFCLDAYKSKWGYIMGAYCQRPADLSSWYFTGQYSGSQEQKALYWKRNSPFVTDCNGLVEGYLTKTLRYKVNARARNNYWSWCSIKGKIGSLQKTPGVAVFMNNPGTDAMHHVGYLLCPIDQNKPNGDWWVVEARGVMYGVVRTKLSARGWSHWGFMDKFFIYDTTPQEAYAMVFGGSVTPSPLTPVVIAKYGDNNSKVEEIQRRLKAAGFVEVGAIDGQFGKLTQKAVKNFQQKNGLAVSGIVYEETYNKLTGSTAVLPKKKIAITGDRVNIRFQPSLTASVLKVALKDETFEPGTATHSEWYSILINGASYWVSKKYTEEKVM